VSLFYFSSKKKKKKDRSKIREKWTIGSVGIGREMEDFLKYVLFVYWSEEEKAVIAGEGWGMDMLKFLDYRGTMMNLRMDYLWGRERGWGCGWEGIDEVWPCFVQYWGKGSTSRS
jgi:hypothetical protein